MNKHDKQVQQYLKQIEAKEATLKGFKATPLKTNAMFSLDFLSTPTTNLRVLSKEKLDLCHAVLELFPKTLVVFGHTISVWQNDIQVLIKTLEHKTQVKELDTLKQELKDLRSDELKKDEKLKDISSKLGSL